MNSVAVNIDRSKATNTPCLDTLLPEIINSRPSRLSRSVKKALNLQCTTCRIVKYCAIKNWPEVVQAACPSYLEQNEQRGGGHEEQIADELGKVSMCKKTIAKFEGEYSKANYYKAINCGKWYCPDCGGDLKSNPQGASIHKMRISKVLSRVDIDKFFGRYLVFTVPEHLRDEFRSKDRLSQFRKLCNKIVLNVFGGDAIFFSSFHFIGDKSDLFNPHLNVVVLDSPQKSWKLSAEVLDDIKFRFNKALTALLGLPHMLDKLNVYYAYRVGKMKLLHTIKYCLKPIESRAIDFEDKELVHFLVVGLKGFQTVQYSKTLKGKGLQETMERLGYERDDFQGLKSPINGEPLRLVGMLSEDQFKREAFLCDLIHLSNGLFIAVDIGEDREDELRKLREPF